MIEEDYPEYFVKDNKFRVKDVNLFVDSMLNNWQKHCDEISHSSSSNDYLNDDSYRDLIRFGKVYNSFFTKYLSLKFKDLDILPNHQKGVLFDHIGALVREIYPEFEVPLIYQGNREKIYVESRNFIIDYLKKE